MEVLLTHHSKKIESRKRIHIFGVSDDDREIAGHGVDRYPGSLSLESR